MPEDAPRTMRRDAVQNRERLLDAARRLFAVRGADVALEEIASAAEVSRTTLYRHFSTREELAAEVLEENVARIEEFAGRLGDAADAVVTLFDFVLDMQQENRSLTQLMLGEDIAAFTSLSVRTIAAFEPLLDRAHQAGIVLAEVTVADVMLAFPMAAGARSDGEAVGRDGDEARVRRMLHRALFGG